MRSAVAVRVASALGSGRGGRAAPVVVKAISGARHRGGLLALVRYVARLREVDASMERPVVCDEMGRELAATSAPRLVADWELPADADNLSAAARRLEEAGRRSDELPPERRWRTVLARHYTFSVPLPRNDLGEVVEADAARLEAAVGEAVRETFGADGFPAIWAVHREHGGHVHAHVVARTVARDGRPLRHDREGLCFDRWRHALAEAARRYGLDVEATRRADRPELVEATIAGSRREDVLRPVPRWDAIEKRHGERRLVDRVPAWFGVEGKEYGRRRGRRDLQRALGARGVVEAWRGEGDGASLFGRLLRRRAPEEERVAEILRRERVYAEDVVEAAARRLVEAARRDREAAWRMAVERPERFGPTRRRRLSREAVRALDAILPRPEAGAGGAAPRAEADPLRRLTERLAVLRVWVDDAGRDRTAEALRRWMDMRREDRALADWYLRHQPIAFGPVSTTAGEVRRDPEVRRLLRLVPVERRPAEGAMRGRADKDADVAELAHVAAAGRFAARSARHLVQLAGAVERLWPEDYERLRQAIALRDVASRLEEVRGAPLVESVGAGLRVPERTQEIVQAAGRAAEGVRPDRGGRDRGGRGR